ncbi:MAG: AAA family ATPase [Oscillospiraceae bacterium]
MGKVMAVANQKGGVGKTTTAINVAACLGKKGNKVLILDTDPQGNTTSGFGINKQELTLTSYDIILGETRISDIIIKTKFKNVDIVPASISLAAAEIELAEQKDRLSKIRNALAPIKDNYDYIIIDCPPSLGLITLNALGSADSIIMPIQCEYYALEGLSQLMDTVRRVKKTSNPNIEVEGVLLTMYDGRLNLTLQVADNVKKYFKDKVFKTVIPRNVRLSEAPSFGQPIIYYDGASKGATAYMDLTKEIIKNNK